MMRAGLEKDLEGEQESIGKGNDDEAVSEVFFFFFFSNFRFRRRLHAGVKKSEPYPSFGIAD